MRNLLVLLLLITSGALYAHSGRTDENGGHYDRINGGYHYHNDGNVNRSNDYYYSNNSKKSDSSNKWIFWFVIPLILIWIVYILNELNVFNNLKYKIEGFIFLFWIIGALIIIVWGFIKLF